MLSRTGNHNLDGPGFGLLLHFAIALGASDELGLRLPSFIASVAAVPLAWLAARAWTGRAGAFFMAACFAVAPPLVFYGREARPYATGLFLGLAVLAAIPAAAKHRGLRAGLAAGAALLAAWQYSWFPLLGVMGVVALVRGRVEGENAGDLVLRRILPLVPAAVVAVACIVELMTVQLARERVATIPGFEAGFYQLSSPTSAVAFLLWKPAELARWLVLGTAGGTLGTVAAVALAAALFGLAAASLARAPRGRELAALALAPIAFMLVAAGVGAHPFGGDRHSLPLVPAALLFASIPMDDERPRVRGAARAIGVLLCGGALVAAPSTSTWGLEDLKGAVAAARAAAEPGDAALVDPYLRLGFETYYGPRARWPGPVLSVTYADPPEAAALRARQALERAPRVWVFWSNAAANDPRRAPAFATLEREATRGALELKREGVDVTLWVRAVK